MRHNVLPRIGVKYPGKVEAFSPPRSTSGATAFLLYGAHTLHKLQLQRAAEEMLIMAKRILVREGEIQPFGIVHAADGKAHVVPLYFTNYEEKRLEQALFRDFIVEMNASAAILIFETWVKTALNRPPDLSRPVSEMPDKQEAMVVEAWSPRARVIIIQIFEKTGRGYVFEEPVGPDDMGATWVSEWFDGLPTH